MKQFPCSYLLLASILAAFAFELATGAVGQDALLLPSSAFPWVLRPRSPAC